MQIREVTAIVKQSKSVQELYDRLKAYVEASINQKAKEFYLKGYLDSLRDFAHWKNGEQFVGTTGKRLSEAIKEKREDINKQF